MVGKKISLLFAALILFLVTVGSAAAGAIDVHAGESIQTAIDVAAPGDTVRVHSGTYSEALTLNKSLVLEGIGNPVLTQTGLNMDRGLIQVEADDSIVRGFTIKDTTGYNFGIQVEAHNVIIEDNILERCSRGIWFNTGSTGCVLRRNVIKDCTSWVGLFISQGGISVYLNDFIGNEKGDISVNGENTWSSPEELEYGYEGKFCIGRMGNFWGSGSGEDSDANGIGDTPGSLDSYPLEKAHSAYSLYAENPSAAAWPQFHMDSAHSGFSPVEVTDSATLAWESENIGAVGSSSVAVADGKVFAVCGPTGFEVGSDGGLACLEEGTGKTLWKKTISAPELGSWSSPAYHDGRVFVSTSMQTRCFGAENGDLLWTFTNPSGKSSCDGGPTAAAGRVFCSDWDGGHYYCLDEESGKLLWTFKAIGTLQGTPTYKKGKIYVTSWKYGDSYPGHVYCLDVNDGSPVWQKDFKSDLCGSISISDDTLYFGSYGFYGDEGKNFYALNSTDGSLRWGQNTPRTDSTPAIAYGNIYVCGGCKGYSDVLTYCFNASTGTLVWKTEAKAPEEGGIGGWTCSPAVADGKVFVGSEGNVEFGYGHAYALNASTGEIVWDYPQGGSSPALADGLVFTTYSGKILALGEYKPIFAEMTELFPTGLELLFDPIDGVECGLEATVKNAGPGTSGACVVTLFANGTAVDTGSLNPLTKGGSGTVEFSWTPASAGAWTLNVSVDCEGAVLESDDTNNSLETEVQVSVARPDLVATGLEPGLLALGRPNTITVTVENRGYADAGSFAVDLKVDGKDIGRKSLDGLEVGKRAALNYSWTPDAEGSFSFTVVPDPKSALMEMNESNNEFETTVPVISFALSESLTLPVTNPGDSLSGYPVRYRQCYLPGMQSDFDDLRFEYEDGREIPYWIANFEEKNSAIFWLKLDLPAKSVTNVTMRYGNEKLPTTGDGHAIFRFFDDFDGDELDSGVWDVCVNYRGECTVSDGWLYLDNPVELTSKQAFENPGALQLGFGARIVHGSSGYSYVGFMDAARKNGTYLYHYGRNDYYARAEKDNSVSQATWCRGGLNGKFQEWEILWGNESISVSPERGETYTVNKNVPEGPLPLSVLTHTRGYSPTYMSRLWIDWIYIKEPVEAEPVISEALPVLPVVNFSVDIPEGEVPLTVHFADESEVVDIVSRAWDFDSDGIVDSTEENPTWTYESAGLYTVSLTVENTAGNSTGVKEDFIKVNLPPMPTANFSVDIPEGEIPLTVHFTQESTDVDFWAWDFENDGIVDSTQAEPTWTYGTAGNYSVNLTVSNEAGNYSVLKPDFIKVNLPPMPTASFTADVLGGEVPITVHFTQASTDVDFWAWDFENDGIVDSTEANPTWTYFAGGSYSVNLTVSNEAGNYSVLMPDYINPHNPPMPTVSFEADVVEGEIPVKVHFTQASTDVDSWAWDFENDGVVDSTEPEPSWTFETAGNFDVNLTVSNEAGSLTLLKESYVRTSPYVREYSTPLLLKNPGSENLSDIQASFNLSWKEGMQPDFEDIRFAYEGGRDIPFWVQEKQDGKYALVWLKLDLPAEGTKEASVLYGNDSALSGSCGEAVFEFFDDFENGDLDESKWRIGWGPLKVENGRLVLAGGGSKGSIESKTLFTAPLVYELQGFAPKAGREHFLMIKEEGGNGKAADVYPISATQMNLKAALDLNHKSACKVNVPSIEELHVHSLTWTEGKANYSVDGVPAGSLESNVGAGSECLAFREDYGADDSFLVDWVFVRRYVENEPVVEEKGDEEPLPVILSFAPEDLCAGAGETVEVRLTADGFPEGLLEYNLTVCVDSPEIAEIAAMELPAWAEQDSVSTLPAATLTFSASDISGQVGEDAGETFLGNLTLRGKSPGSVNLTLRINTLTDDSNSTSVALTRNTTLRVNLDSLPGCEYSPKDLDGDGTYEDLTGNGAFSFKDLEVYFNNLDRIRETRPVAPFDYNGNGRVDFADVVLLFKKV